MSEKADLSQICPYRLNETYHAVFEKQQLLNLTDKYMLSTVRFQQEDEKHREALKELLDLFKKARDNIIIWYLKQTLLHLNVTVSLVTAKIKLIEYKLGLANGLDLHQASSIALVDFSNIICDLTVIKASTGERKTIHRVTAEKNIPAWLIHYRNLICHVPSEGPNISILVPLVQKALNYMQKYFWSPVLDRTAFDEQKFKRIVLYLTRLTHVRNVLVHLYYKRDSEIEPHRYSKSAKANMKKHQKVCSMFRRTLIKTPAQAVDVMTRILVETKINNTKRQHSLLLVQLTLSRCFESFVFKLISLAEEKPNDKNLISWITAITHFIGCANRKDLEKRLLKFGISNVGMAKYIDLAPLKCCHIAYRLMRLEGRSYKRCVMALRHKLLPLLGKQRTLLLIKMTRIASHEKS